MITQYIRPDMSLSKQYIVYDSNGNMSSLYIAPTNSSNGDSCLLIEFNYDSNNKVIKTKESQSIWDSSWDL